MKKGDYQTIKKAVDYETKRFAGGLSIVARDEAKIIESWIKKARPRSFFLDLGTGTGRIVRSLIKVKPTKIYALDSSKAMLSELKTIFNKEIKKKKLKTIVSKADKIPLKKNSVDLLTSFHLFKHIQDIRPVISESARVIKTGGYAIFDVLNPNSIVRLNLETCCAISESEVRKILIDNNFKVLKVVYLHAFGETVYRFLDKKTSLLMSKLDRSVSKYKFGTKILFLAQKK